ncbi:MAG: hypothetical protein ACREN5_04620 [Gemmatimonadales bacterium]
MRTHYTWPLLALAVSASGLLAQADTSPLDTAPRPVLTPGQQAYQTGLRTVGRGIAQLKTGVSRVVAAEGARDTVTLRQAGQRLAAICRAAAGFMASGRPQMRPFAFDPPIRESAQSLRARVDSVNAYLPDCTRRAARHPGTVKEGLIKRLTSYETALAEYRVALVTPVGQQGDSLRDTTKAPQH